MNRHFKIADGVAAGQVAHCVSDEKQDCAGFAGSLAQLAQRVLLVSR